MMKPINVEPLVKEWWHNYTDNLYDTCNSEKGYKRALTNIINKKNTKIADNLIKYLVGTFNDNDKQVYKDYLDNHKHIINLILSDYATSAYAELCDTDY